MFFFCENIHVTTVLENIAAENNTDNPKLVERKIAEQPLFFGTLFSVPLRPMSLIIPLLRSAAVSINGKHKQRERDFARIKRRSAYERSSLGLLSRCESAAARRGVKKAARQEQRIGPRVSRPTGRLIVSMAAFRFCEPPRVRCS